MKSLRCLRCPGCRTYLGCATDGACLATILLVALAVSVPRRASAHDLQFTYTALVLRADGTFQADVTCDLDALALGLAQATPADQVVARVRTLAADELEAKVGRLRERLTQQITLRFDGVPVPKAVGLPERDRPPADPAVPTVLGLTARFTGEIPRRAHEVTVNVDRSLPPLYLTIIEQRSGRHVQQVLQRGETSAPFDMQPRPSRPAWLLPAFVFGLLGLAVVYGWRRKRKGRRGDLVME